MSWLRRSFLTGLVVTVPLLITVVTLVWFFRFIDGLARPLSMAVLGREVPGLGVLMTAGFILVTGAVATNVIGRRMLQRDRTVAAERAAVQDGVCAREAAGGGVFARQRDAASRRSWSSTTRSAGWCSGS